MGWNKFMLLAIGVVVCASVYSQKVTVQSHSEKGDGENIEGFITELEGRKAQVAPLWNKFLREFGKSRPGAGFTTISGPALGGTVYPKGILYADLREKGETTTVWLGYREGTWEANDEGIIKREMEKELYGFGVKFYKDQIQGQIDEAQRASEAVVRQQQRLANQSRELTIQLGNNEQEKIKLEQRLEANTLEHAVLLQKLENNKLAQDSVAQAGNQVKKMIEVHKERQNKVN